MNVALDTNILVRSVVRDDVAQARLADRVLREAALLAVSSPCLCELVWVLGRTYDLSATDISAAVRALYGAANVVMNRPAVELGLAALDAGGDFADAVIAYEGKWLGGDVFLSFDRKAVALMKSHGYDARLLR